MAVGAWPGWLQPPQPTQPWSARRAEWRVEADPGYERAAKRLAAWRSAGDLPPDVHGLATSFHFGNMAAWFAPGERVFVNSRFNFHAPELLDLLELRKALTPSRDGEDRIDAAKVKEITDKYGAGFLVLLPIQRMLEGTAGHLMREEPDVWHLWHIDGRSSFLGRAGKLAPAAERKLAYDPVKEAFAPDLPPLPEGSATSPVERTWLDEFRSGVKPPPIETDDALVYELQARGVQRQAEEFFHFRLQYLVSAVTGIGVQLHVPVMRRPVSDISDTERALAVLELRAARRAVAANSDAPDAFAALFAAYQNPALPDLWPDSQQFPAEKLAQRQTAAVRYLSRIPPPGSCTREQARRAFDLAAGLAQSYMRLNQLDFAQEAMKKAKAYYPMGRGVDELENTDVARGQGEEAGKQADARRKAIAESVDKEEKRLTDVVGEQIGRFEAAAAKGSAAQKFQTAMRAGLPRRAIEAFKADVAAFGENQAPIALAVLDLELVGGRLEDAARDFETWSPDFNDMLKKLPKPQADALEARVRDFEYRKCVLEGNYTLAGVIWEQLNGRYPKLREEDRALVLGTPRGPVAELAVAGAHGVAGLLLFAGHVQQANLAITSLLAESQFAHVRGLLFLIEGQVGEARKRFAAAPAPQGITNLPLPWADLDRQYLRMIDAAAK
jgi:tetratricopeptide (TPR) repeat protein